MKAVFALMVVTSLLASCSKVSNETASEGAGALKAASDAPKAPAEAAPSRESMGEAAATPMDASVVDGSAVSDASSAFPKVVTCGKKPLPDCPMQAWMKEHATPPMTAKDLPALAAAFEDMIPLAPPKESYPHWVSISKDGADAARAKDLGAVKAACRGCHQQYKDKYRSELRDRPLTH